MPRTKSPRTSQMSIKVVSALRSDLEKIAAINRTTLTELTNDALTAYVQKHTADIERYEEVFERR